MTTQRQTSVTTAPGQTISTAALERQLSAPDNFTFRRLKRQTGDPP